MARFLALDADTLRLQVLAASVKGSAVRLEKTAAWDEDQPLSPATASDAGKRFRETIKAAGIGPAPLLVCLGRDRVIFKEIKIPVVPPHEEPNVVKFQAQKEFTESGDVVLDYTPLGVTGNNEKRVLVAAAKKEAVAASKKLAEAAGLKLVAITPRPFATLAGLNQAFATGLVPKPANPDDAIALLVRGDKWGEFTVSRNGVILQSRSLAGPALTNETALLGEIRRTLAVHSNQNLSQPVTAVYVAEPDSPGGLRERLQNALSFPVHAYEPVVGVSLPDGPLGTYAGLAGMFALRGAAPELPINFAAPRHPKPPRDPGKRLLLLVGAGLGAFAVLLLIVGLVQLTSKNRKLAALQKQKNTLESQLHTFDADAKRIKALDEWSATEVNWLDELYDITARVPDINKLRVTNIQTSVVDDPSHKKKQVAAISLKGISTDSVPVDRFMSEWSKEPSYQVPGPTKSPNRAIERQRFPQAFVNKIEVEKRTPDKYSRSFTATPPAKRTRPGQGDGGMPGVDFIGGFGP
jgi:Tfp pilus assembly protein PilN